MSVFTFHLASTSVISGFNQLLNPPVNKNVPGLIHSELMTSMTLGSQVFSPSRILVRETAFFAQWENEEAIDNFLLNDAKGNYWSQYIRSFRDRLVVSSVDGKVVAMQKLTLWGLRVLEFRYEIFQNHN